MVPPGNLFTFLSLTLLRIPLQLFLDLLLVSKHIPQSIESTSTEPLIPTPTLASSVLDTLLCILVDNPEAIRAFEDVGGLDVIVRTLKRSSVSRDVRSVFISQSPKDTLIDPL
jgi:hypothetical protein